MPYKRKIVLVVDDDRDFLSELQESLALSGYIPLIAANEAETMLAARKIKPDVILLDLKLGNENGFIIADKIRKDPSISNIPIIMMSGYFNEAGGGESLAPSPVNIYLNKPFTQKDVVRSIQETLADAPEPSFDVMKHFLFKT